MWGPPLLGNRPASSSGRTAAHWSQATCCEYQLWLSCGAAHQPRCIAGLHDLGRTILRAADDKGMTHVLIQCKQC
jgi:hypothetical protein